MMFSDANKFPAYKVPTSDQHLLKHNFVSKIQEKQTDINEFEDEDDIERNEYAAHFMQMFEKASNSLRQKFSGVFNQIRE